MRESILTKEWTVSAVNGGSIVVENIFGTQFSFNGYIDQIIVRASAGGGANFDMQIRRDDTSSNIEDLIYSTAAEPFPMTDSAINAPFDTARAEDKDLSIWMDPAVNGTVVIRIDFRLLG